MHAHQTAVHGGMCVLVNHNHSGIYGMVIGMSLAVSFLLGSQHCMYYGFLFCYDLIILG